MTEMPRRTALAVLGAAGTVAALAYLLRTTIRMPAGRAEGPGMMGGISGTDMSRYMAMFARHNELRRTVEDIPGGIRTVTESGAPDLVAQLHAHVSSMTCMSDSLPTLFRRASDYQRQITLTSNGVAVIETATDPALIDAIRAHAREVTGFVVNGMPTMMGPMMGR